MGCGCFVQTVASSLNGVNASLSTVPDLTAYIASLTPAVAAYTALGPTIITDMQTQITSINSTITSVNARPLRDPSRHTLAMCMTLHLKSCTAALSFVWMSAQASCCELQFPVWQSLLPLHALKWDGMTFHLA